MSNQENAEVEAKPVKKSVAKKATKKKAIAKPAKKAAAKKATKKTPVKKATKKPVAKKPAVKKSAPRGRQEGINKAEFVRARPAMSTKELIEAAKANRFTLSANYIYVIRGKATKTTPKATRGPGRPRANGASNGHVDGDNLLFMNSVAQEFLTEDFMQQVARRVAVLLVGDG